MSRFSGLTPLVVSLLSPTKDCHYRQIELPAPQVESARARMNPFQLSQEAETPTSRVVEPAGSDGSRTAAEVACAI